MNKEELLNKIKNNKLSIEELVQGYLDLVEDIKKLIISNKYLEQENNLLREKKIK